MRERKAPQQAIVAALQNIAQISQTGRDARSPGPARDSFARTMRFARSSRSLRLSSSAVQRQRFDEKVSGRAGLQPIAGSVFDVADEAFGSTLCVFVAASFEQRPHFNRRRVRLLSQCGRGDSCEKAKQPQPHGKANEA